MNHSAQEGSAAANRPRRVEGKAKVSARAAEPAGPVRPWILVVEDDPLFASSLVRIIESLGCDAAVAGTAGSASAHLVDIDAWAAVTLDVSLIDGSGLEVLSQIRSAHYNTPALILTGLLDHDVANAAFELHAEYLVKPVKAIHLEEWVRRVTVQQSASLPAAVLVVSQELPDDLHRLAEAVLGAGIAERNEHAEYAYRLALLARAASGRTYRGQSVTEACAKSVNVSRSMFSDYIAMTTRWSPSDVRGLLRRRDCRGRLVTLHHLLAAVRAPPLLRRDFVSPVRAASFRRAEKDPKLQA